MNCYRRAFFITLVVLVFYAAGCAPATTQRQEQVAAAGAEVMPFDLERTTHIFEKLDNGGLQQVISDDGDAEQIALIREHLSEEAERFGQGDFHDPAMIHGEDMAGLHELMMGAEALTLQYSELENGAQILYTTEDGDLVDALHAWFDQQLADHGDHAQTERP
ncbi:MAG: aspartate carbamoyltransferase [Ardenticatenales bacterium]|nr:aspartate carbamoyltransferase [Ardenticatenales bacterium]